MQRMVNAAARDAGLDWPEFARTVACARITTPTSCVRLSAGRREVPEAAPAVCVLAGADSIVCGDRLRTTGNPDARKDRGLLERLALAPRAPERV